MKTQSAIKSIVPACAMGIAAFVALVVAMQADVIRAAPDSPAAPRAPGAPDMIHYQGRLSRVSGAPVPDTISVTFSIYNQPAGGTLLWSARYDGVTVTRGVFNVMLGGATPFSQTGSFGAALFADDTRYLEVTIITSTLSPRQRIGSVAYALAAKSAISAPWSGLTGIPPDIANGDDNTTYSAGPGLTLNATTFQVISAPVAITSTTAWRADLATNATTATYAVDGPFVHRLGPDTMTSASATATFSLDNIGSGAVISATAAGPGNTIVAVAGPGVAISATSKTNIAVDALTGTGLAAVRGQNPLNYGGWFLTGANANMAGVYGVARPGTNMAGVRGEIGGPAGVTPLPLPWPQNYGVQGEHTPASSGTPGTVGTLGAVRGGTQMPGTSSVGVMGVNIGPVSPPRAAPMPYAGQIGVVFANPGTLVPIPMPFESLTPGMPAEYGVRGTTISGVAGSAGVLGETMQPQTAGVYGRCNLNPIETGGCYGVFSDGDAFVNGNLYVTGAKVGYVIDIARNAGDAPLRTGDVVVIVGAGDPVVGDIPTPLIVRAGSAYATDVMGVVETTQDGKAIAAPGEPVKVVTLGVFKTIKVDASFGAIQPGDLLVSSPNPGYAMKTKVLVLDGVPMAPAGVIGKALGALDSGVGEIAVLVGSR